MDALSVCAEPTGSIGTLAWACCSEPHHACGELRSAMGLGSCALGADRHSGRGRGPAVSDVGRIREIGVSGR